MKTLFQEQTTAELEFRVGGLRLRGTLHLPDHRPAPVVIGCHGLLSSRRSPKQEALAQACRDRGLAYFRFDHRGCGDSEGRLETDCSLEKRVNDLLHAVRLLQRRADIQKRLGLFGSSMGGAVCIRAAAAAAPCAIVTCAAPIRSRSLPGVFRSAGSDGRLAALLTKKEFDLASDLPEIHRLLLFHGDADDVVPLAHAYEIIQGAGHPKRLVIQKNGDHRMSDPRHQEEFVREATRWFARALKLPAVG